MNRRQALHSCLALALCAGVASSGWRPAGAADHLDPPLRTDPSADAMPDKAADIADIYLFQSGPNLVMALTFAGPQATTLPATYDRDVLYGLNLSNDGDAGSTEYAIRIRFGQDAQGNSGLRITGLPGNTVITGPVEQDLTANGITARAGLFDDPFFFDSQGLRETRSTGTFRFDRNRDFFGAQNITAIVIQIPLAQVVSGDRQLDLWAETARFGGQL